MQPIHLTPQVAFLGYLDKTDKNFLIQNMILATFKLHVHKLRVSSRLDLSTVSASERKEYVEKGASFNIQRKSADRK